MRSAATGIHIAGGSGPGRILGESLATVLIVLAGLSFAGLLLRARTLDESRRQALTDLAEANNRLQASLRDSRDLVLAQERPSGSPRLCMTGSGTSSPPSV